MRSPRFRRRAPASPACALAPTVSPLHPIVPLRPAPSCPPINTATVQSPDTTTHINTRPSIATTATIFHPPYVHRHLRQRTAIIITTATPPPPSPYTTTVHTLLLFLLAAAAASLLLHASQMQMTKDAEKEESASSIIISSSEKEELKVGKLLARIHTRAYKL